MINIVAIAADATKARIKARTKAGAPPPRRTT